MHAVRLIEALKQLQLLTVLVLWNCSLGDEEAAMIALFIQQNHSLQYLHLECNHIGLTGICAIIASLKQSRRVKVLALDGNSAGKSAFGAPGSSGTSGTSQLPEDSMASVLRESMLRPSMTPGNNGQNMTGTS